MQSDEDFATGLPKNRLDDREGSTGPSERIDKGKCSRKLRSVPREYYGNIVGRGSAVPAAVQFRHVRAAQYDLSIKTQIAMARTRSATTCGALDG